MFYLNKLLDNFKATNDLLLSVAKKHNALSAIINNGNCVLQDVIDNNNLFIDNLRNHQKNGGWISVDDDLPTLESKENYLVYSTFTEVYEKVDAKKLRIMINNSAKITH